ncbi:restriction endonuclease subunit S [Citrobacter sp. Cpo044]|uniref:restriction endonuclease subunit S n=1 Tax=Citrobacter sp. Cpo044 TaxID=2985127 RepID=UPI002575936B|nr:restriction endonuclease subunit S [Citrobacter sp. Cpo044]MBJ9848832.1 restriction endonuclease subunit S [Citrobacter freundii]MDM2883338.1 restriction endonuclease subunit S [Citrobacter sp. Cpo044]
MAKYKAYPEYKDSGVEWLGKIPSGWLLKKTKYIFQRVQRPLRDIDGVVTAFRDGQVTLRTNRRTDGFTNSVKEIGYQGVRRNDLVIHAMDGFAGAIGVSDSDGKCSPVCSVCIPWENQTVNMHFYGYLVRQLAVTDFILSLAKGIRERSTEFRFSEFSGLMLPIPPIYEQNQIATFLDYETAKIDHLIEKQQQLIELLKEKRQTVISHAVTKGLNPDVPMKDSGVEWLGDVPKHWDVCAIKHIVSTPITDGPHETPDFIDDGIPFISAEAISSGVIDFDKKRACISIKDHKRFSKKYSPQFNDIYMVKSGATTGITAIVETYDDFNIWSPLAVIRCNDYSNPYFVINFMRSKPFQTAIELNWSYGTQQNIGMGVIGNLHIARPPVSEAIEIATHLRAKCSKFDELIDIAMMQISIMQERRTALISAAVTGKIDVRDWVAPDSQDVEEPEEATA